MGYKWIDGGVTAPKGFKAAGVAAGIKTGSTKKDCALVASEVEASVAGTFTTNMVKAAPVYWCTDVVSRGIAQAVFLNSGNANACTGEPGLADTRTTAEAVGKGLGVPGDKVLVCSTGVIGLPLPMERILKGVSVTVENLSEDGGADAARAIMTTDTVPKEVAMELEIGGVTVRIGAMAKGAGMIAPNMATMLSVVTTDAAISADNLAQLLRKSVSVSYNQICVDNDTSTNDTVLCMANGCSGVGPLEPGTPEYEAFASALTTLCREIAQKLVRDGEGATKFVEIAVSGAVTDEAARTVARSIATSQLCKTAFFGQDPNWGRIACAAGYSGISFDATKLSIWLNDIALMEEGCVAKYKEEDAAACMLEKSFSFKVKIGDGPGFAEFWTSDLSHDYVSINADYRS